MILKLQNHISQNFPFLVKKKLLLATSGGLDSMVLLHLMEQLGFEIAIAHCNFQLRGLESFGDQNFVQEYADKHQIKVFITQFDTENFAKDYKLSTQVAARELRYNWFYELLETQNFDYLLTAHHADDNLETFIINLSRTTGLDGLVGIPAQNDKIIRPLLPFSRQEIEDFAKQNNIAWREDASNASDKYLRNKIRHHLVPLIKELNPDFLSAFQKTQNYLQESQSMVEDAAIMVYQQVASEVDEVIYFDLKKLKKLPNYPSYLYQWLQEFGFTAWQDIYDLVASQSGKQVFSETYRLVKDRDFLLLKILNTDQNKAEFIIHKEHKNHDLPIKIEFCKVADISLPNDSVIFVDEDKMTFPLTLRHWNEGDHFQPFGMDGKSKKVSKFFKDEKLSLIEKEKIWILSSENQIVWIVGMRQDERFRTDKNTENSLKITLKS
jgi:tRNA(Ile)-lysidine synthase